MEIILEKNQQENTQIQEKNIVEENEYKGEINLYPILRTIFIILCIILVVGLVAFLIYQNGKSIYDNGL